MCGRSLQCHMILGANRKILFIWYQDVCVFNRVVSCACVCVCVWLFANIMNRLQQPRRYTSSSRVSHSLFIIWGEVHVSDNSCFSALSYFWVVHRWCSVVLKDVSSHCHWNTHTARLHDHKVSSHWMLPVSLQSEKMLIGSWCRCYSARAETEYKHSSGGTTKSWKVYSAVDLWDVTRHTHQYLLWLYYEWCWLSFNFELWLYRSSVYNSLSFSPERSLLLWCVASFHLCLIFFCVVCFSAYLSSLRPSLRLLCAVVPRWAWTQQQSILGMSGVIYDCVWNATLLVIFFAKCLPGMTKWFTTCAKYEILYPTMHCAQNYQKDTFSYSVCSSVV